MTSASNVLEVERVSKSWPGVRALKNVDFAVAPGEVHALIGENGAGKSTLIKVMTGVYSADSGEVRYDGRRVDFASPLEAQQAGISTIYQEINLIPLMSVARNLFLGREPRKWGVIDSRRMNSETRQVLKEFGVDVNPTRPLHTLGLGAQQMVAIARAVQIDAKVVIMDEPTSSLERREVETLFSVIERLKSSGIAIVYVSHRLDELYQVAQNVTVMRDGAVVHVGPIAKLPRLELVSLMLGRDASDLQISASAAKPETREGESALHAQHLTARHRLDDVSVEVWPGEVLGLGGLLGAGRSETAKAITGALHTEAGSVRVHGKPIRRNSIRASIDAGVVMLPEDRKAEGIIPGLSVRENITLAGLRAVSSGGVIRGSREHDIVSYYMDRLKIKASSPEQRVGELSGGNQQKVMLARWLCLHPQVLLLDEPTRGIDVGAKAEVTGVIEELAKDGLSVILISSDVDELVGGVGRLVVLKDGRVVDELHGDQISPDGLMQALAQAPSTEGLVDD
ncbi:MAG TPA: sugar ABC transporter ATP-binding protein [Flexivirga sp.]|uniref:sugar ABC transporter ATP-binding protein n=1 Tax=Flexivirga sp. TaxID=1962927 RepID=UPI002C559E30|nr:sugar ABC transporter ATP-binding protein [Flexivirga sp.]HWC24184.1 sugar ABC transporter ATP-binding protein [Flexivirga sp.]